MFLSNENNGFQYKRDNSFESRIKECVRIRKRYPTRVPVIIESQSIIFDKNRFLFPKDISVSMIPYIIKKHVNLDPVDCIFVLVNNKLLSSSSLIGTVYENNKDKDGFLYVSVEKENSFG